MHESPQHLAITEAHARAVRRRLCVFAVCFVLAGALSLGWNFTRPAVYRSEATLLVTPRASGNPSPPGNEAGAPTDVSAVARQRHVISHPSVLAQVWQRFADQAEADGDIALEASDLHTMLQAAAVPETNVIELSAEGPRPEDLPLLVNAWVDVCLAEHATAEQASSRSGADAAREQIIELQQRIERMRGELADFRSRHDIASMQREENRVLARLKGLTESLNEVEANEVAARARADALKDALARGEDVALDQDREELSIMQAQLRELRALLQGLEAHFAAEYLDKDQEVAKLKQRIKLLEEEIEAKRGSMGRAALAQTEVELDTARNAATAIRQQLAEHERMAANFTTRFAEHESLVEDLAQLEALHRDLQERVVELEVMREALPPELSVVQRASTADYPVRPAYRRDAAIGLAGSFLFGLAAVVLDWLITRPPRAAGVAEARTVFYPWPQIQDLARAHAGEVTAASPAGVLEHRPPRELGPAELTELLRAGSTATRSVLGVLLSGLTVDEACALRWSHVDFEQGVIRVPGHDARTLDVSPRIIALLTDLEPQPANPAAPVWPNANGGPLSAGAVNSLLVSAAHVACLESPAEVDAEALRRTHAALALRQNTPHGQSPKILDQILADIRESQATAQADRGDEGTEQV